MPLYEYKCEAHGEFDQFFKSLPSEAKQKSFPCPECDQPAPRMVSAFLVGGTQNGEIEKSVAMSLETADIGGRQRPVYRDANGRMHEVKSMFDVQRWKKSNQLGKPRMVLWHNPKTGEKSYVPMRQSMQVDPQTGEPAEPLFGINPIIKESVEMVELGDNYDIPTETRTGIPIDRKTGVPVVRDISKIPIPGTGRMIDPETKKPMTMGDVWGAGNPSTGPQSNRAQARELLKGKQMSRSEAARRIAE